jgi:3D (Asp-Asp-Asp) domain-containing protein
MSTVIILIFTSTATANERAINEQDLIKRLIQLSAEIDMQIAVWYELAYLIESQKPKSAGVFEITWYCAENYPHICNNGDSTYTASGTLSTPYRTASADWDVLPPGTVIIVDGHEWIIEDKGGAIKGNRLDLMVETHAEVMSKGKSEAKVFIKKEGN